MLLCSMFVVIGAAPIAAHIYSSWTHLQQLGTYDVPCPSANGMSENCPAIQQALARRCPHGL